VYILYELNNNVNRKINRDISLNNIEHFSILDGVQDDMIFGLPKNKVLITSGIIILLLIVVVIIYGIYFDKETEGEKGEKNINETIKSNKTKELVREKIEDIQETEETEDTKVNTKKSKKKSYIDKDERDD